MYVITMERKEIHQILSYIRNKGHHPHKYQIYLRNKSALIDDCIYLPNDMITSTVRFTEVMDGKQISITESGSLYITLPFL